MTTVTIDQREKNIELGLTAAENLYSLLECTDDRKLYLNRTGGIDIPVFRNEYIIIHGGESFVSDPGSSIEDNPPLREPLTLQFNGKPLPAEHALKSSKITGRELKSLDDKFPAGRLFVDIDRGVDKEIEDNFLLIVQELDSYFVIPASADSSKDIDTEECAKNDRKPPKGHHYRIRIDGDKHVVNESLITCTAILALVGKDTENWHLNQKFTGGRRQRVESEQVIDVSELGVERFETVRMQAQQGNDE